MTSLFEFTVARLSWRVACRRTPFAKITDTSIHERSKELILLACNLTADTRLLQVRFIMMVIQITRIFVVFPPCGRIQQDISVKASQRSSPVLRESFEKAGTTHVLKINVANSVTFQCVGRLSSIHRLWQCILNTTHAIGSVQAQG